MVATHLPYGQWASSDRLLVTLVIAVIVHAGVIFGVAFELPTPPKIRKSLEIVLVHTPSPVAPEKAEYLAPEHQFGSGEAQHKNIPKAEPLAQVGQGRTLTASPPAPPKSQRAKSVATQIKSEKKVQADRDGEATTEPARPHLSVDLLSQQIAEFSAEYTQALNARALKPRTVYINSVNAHKYKAAAYERAWQDKVERIGNLNYPDEARRRNLSGSLLLSVSVKADGTLHAIQVRRSSGHPVLDEAAVRIVRLAAPFAPFPAELRAEADVLVITRTWKFLGDNRVETTP